MTTRPLRPTLTALTAALVLSACTGEAPPPPPGAAAPASPAAPEVEQLAPVVDPAAMLEVKDQTSEGPTVFARAAATQGGFVVVYADGGLNTLGTGIVEPGTEPQQVLVSLAEEVNEKTELLARLFADTNGDGLYGAGDLPISNGEDDASDDVEVFPGEQEQFSFTGKPVVTS